MNVIQYALKTRLPYQKKLELFARHGNQPGLVQTLRRGENPQNKRILDFNLKRLRFKKGLPGADTSFSDLDSSITEEVAPGIIREAKNRPTRPRKEKKHLYPDVISQALRERKTAINAREKAGRKLTDEAETLSKKERAILIDSQKTHHETVARLTGIIKAWEQAGELPEPEQKETEKEEKPVLSPKEKERLEKEWTEMLRIRSRARAGIKKWTGTDQKRRLQRHKDNLKRAQARIDTLRIILNKKREWGKHKQKRTNS